MSPQPHRSARAAILSRRLSRPRETVGKDSTVGRIFSVSDLEGRPLRTLVIEDEPLLRWAIVETLRRTGHVVAEAGDGATGLRVLQDAGPIDVVLMDYGLSGAAGLELLARVRRLSPRSAVVMMSGYPTPEVADTAIAHGVDRFLVKPFEMESLEAELRTACDRHARHAGDCPPTG